MGFPTLSDFYFSTFLEMRILARDLDPKTRKSYEESVSHWVMLTGDPSLDSIDDRMCAKFISDLSKQKGKLAKTMMKTSIGKHCVNLKAILEFAGPRTPKVRGQKLIIEVPYFDPPRPDQEPPCKDFSIDEMRAMYLAADCMTKPVLEGVKPGDWWRALLVVGYFTGFRTGTLGSIEYSMISDCWLVAPARISKRRKGKKQYLRKEVLEHIEKIRVNGREVILEWPRWPKSRRTCYDYLRKLQIAAGMPKHRRFAIGSLRKTHLTVLASGETDPNVGVKTAQASAGHVSDSITRGHYISGTVQDRLVAHAIDAMRNPFV